MIRQATLIAVALASAAVPDEIDQLRAEMANEKAAMQTKLDELQKRLETMGTIQIESNSGKLYSAVNGRKMTDGTAAPEVVWATMTDLKNLWSELATGLSTAWIILCGAIVFFMNAGFALLESGVCRAVSCQSVFLKNMLDACLGTLIWWACGYTFMYGSMADGADGTPLQVIGGIDNQWGFFGHGLVDTTADPVVTQLLLDPSYLVTCQDWFFQWAFCVAAATIVSGGVAERLQMGGYLTFTSIMTGFIYPTVSAMTWGYGALYDLGYSDFAGSGIVHLTGGIGALWGAIITGPRVGRFDAEGLDPNGTYAAHNIPNVALGTFILWFGWYGFNCGSTLYMSGMGDAQSAGLVAVNTTICAASGGVTAMFLRRFILEPKSWSISPVCGGILGGLVSITAGCGNIHPRAAPIVGIIGGIVYCAASEALQKLKIDDPVEAFPVHGACGIWGVLAVPIFDINTIAMVEGDRYGGSTLFAQIAGIVVITLWVSFFSAILFGVIKVLGFLRVDEEHEKMGIDNAEFSPKAAYKSSGNI